MFQVDDNTSLKFKKTPLNFSVDLDQYHSTFALLNHKLKSAKEKENHSN